MSISKKIYGLILLLFLSLPSLSKQTTVIESGHNTYQLTQKVSILEDPSAQLTFEQITSPIFNNNFKPIQSENVNFGFTQSTIWLKFTIKNTTEINYWLLRNEYNALEIIDLYEVENNRLVNHFLSGTRRSLDQRVYPSHRIIFPVIIPTNEQRTYYVKVRSFTPLIINLSLSSESALIQSNYAADLPSGIVLGITIVLLIINLIFYSILKFKSQLFLTIYILCSLILYSAYDNYLVYLIPESAATNSTLILLTSGSIAYISLYFYIEYLLLNKLKKKYKSMIRYTVIPYFVIVNILAYSTSILLPYQMYVIAVFLLPFIGACYSGYAWRAKQYHARLVFIGLCGLATAQFFQMSLLFNLLHSDLYISIELTRFGNIILITLLSTAIVDYIQQLQQQKQQSHDKAIQAENKFKRVFEQAYQMLFLISAEGIVISVNKQASRFLDKPKSELIKQNFTDIFTSLKGVFDQDAMKKNIEKAIFGQLIKQNIVAYSNKGTLKDLEISYQPYVNHQQEVNNVLVQVRDITKESQAFKAIQNMVVGIASLSTENFFKNFLIEISRVYNAKYVMLSQLNDSTPMTATTVAVINDKKPIANFTYEIANTPSEKLIDNHLGNYPNDVQVLFPQDEWISSHNIVSYLGVNIKDSDGHIIGFLSVLDDRPLDEDNYFIEVLDVFAARIANELRHQESQEALKTALEKLDFHITNTPLGVIEWDTSFNIVKWNKAAKKIFGFSMEDFEGKAALKMLLPRSEIAHVVELTKELIANKGGYHSLSKNLTKEGKEILCEWHNTPLLNSDGEVTGVASMINDVTAEHNALSALYLKEHEQNEIFNALTDAIFIIDQQGKVLSTNRAVQILFGYKMNELVGKRADILLTGKFKKYYDKYLAILLTSLPKQHLPVNREIWGRRKDGEQFQLNLSLTAMPNDNSGQKRILATCHDLTEFKIQQESLKQSHKMDALGSLTGGIAHDFNNLLGIINGYAELLTHHAQAESKDAKYVQHILNASSRGAKLTKKLLSFAQKNTEDKELVDINQLLCDEYDMLQKTLTPRITLTLDLDDNLPLTNIDKSELQDCILNLTINAMHAIEDHGEITIDTTIESFTKQQAQLRELVAGQYIKLTIKDNGKGMDEQVQQKALEPFFTTKGNTGTGLGLSQVYGFVERSNGFIDIQSQLNHGTEISLFLPADKRKLSSKTSKTHSPTDIVQNASVLVVDDEPSLVELSYTVLSNAGYQVYTADSGEQALIVLEQHKVDALLCDVIMPNMGGVELAKIVEKQYPDTAILFISGYYEQNSPSVNQFITDKVIKKPYETSELIQRITQCIMEKRKSISHKLTH
ncbi:PAS domain S-box protein [Thalassotalea sp. G2M2-11]|uniref:PAS domain S-box protein n=1 Tax=Thalassotalea sp. G2M2-11 TaxID=2787627 RepID=UPI0019CFADFC|nr:PAS domain S-box protein [Thalassotalea sp. G2M2-11]